MVLLLSSYSCCRRRSRKVGGVAGSEEREHPSAGVRGIGLTRRGKSNYLPAHPPSQGTPRCASPDLLRVFHPARECLAPGSLPPCSLALVLCSWFFVRL